MPLMVRERDPVVVDLAHGGHFIPPEVYPHLIASPQALVDDGDQFSDEIYLYHPTLTDFIAYNEIWRALYDGNRRFDDRSVDGSVKQYTSQAVQIYRDVRGLPLSVADEIIRKYGIPYHTRLRELVMRPDVRGVLYGHTMPAISHLGRRHPLIMLGNSGNQYGNPNKDNIVPLEAMEYFRDIVMETLEHLNIEGVPYGNLFEFNTYQKNHPSERFGEDALPLKDRSHPIHGLGMEVNRSLLKIHPKNIVALRTMIARLAKELSQNSVSQY